MIPHRFYVDGEGYPMAEIPPPYEAAGTYLSHEVQTLNHALDLILRIREVMSGARPIWIEDGNAFEVAINADRVRIHCDFDDNSSFELSTDDYLELLQGWSQLFRK